MNFSLNVGIIILILFCLLGFLSGKAFSEGVIMEVKDFQKEVLESSRLVIVDFWATWCKPCFMMTGNLERIVNFNKIYNRNKLRVLKVNVDKNRKLMSKYSVRGLPTLVFFKEGKEVSRIIGLTPFLKIQDVINSLFKKWELEERKEKKDKKVENCEGGTCPIPPEYN